MAAKLTQSEFLPNSNPFRDKAWLVIALLLAVVLAIWVGYFLQTHERVLDTPKYSLTPQASMNRFLASERLLQAEHKKVYTEKGESAKTALDGVWQQPNETAKKNAVILYSLSKNQETSIPQMLNWVEKGGHLITFSQDTLNSWITPDDAPDEEDIRQYEQGENTLLNTLGIRHMYNAKKNDNKSTDAPPPDSATAATPKLSLDNKIIMRLPKLTGNTIDTHNPVEAVINIDNESHLDSEKFWQKYPNAQKWAEYNWVNDSNQLIAPNQTLLIPSEQQQLTSYLSEQEKKYNLSVKADAVMLDIKLGEGRITVLNSKDIFTNPSSYDLQSLAERQENRQKSTDSPLWQALQSSEYVPKREENIASLDNGYLLKYLMADRQQVWFVPDIDVPSLPVMLWRSAKWACVAFALLLAVGMLALPKRFGRVQRYQTDSERNIFGYFDHVGQYLWHTDQAKALFAQNRTRLIEQIIAKQPQFFNYAPDQLCQAIGEQLNIGKSAVNLALYSDWHSPEQFLQCTRQFAVIRQTYS